MGFFRATGKGLGVVFNFRVDKWVGYKNLKATSSNLLELGKSLVQIQQSKRQESFEDSLQRLNLSEAQVLKKQQVFFYLMLFYLLMASLILMYGFYLAFQGQILPFITTLAITTLCLTNYFRYSFWRFQMRHKKLGCSFKEWWNDEIL